LSSQLDFLQLIIPLAFLHASPLNLIWFNLFLPAYLISSCLPIQLDFLQLILPLAFHAYSTYLFNLSFTPIRLIYSTYSSRLFHLILVNLFFTPIRLIYSTYSSRLFHLILVNLFHLHFFTFYSTRFLHILFNLLLPTRFLHFHCWYWFLQLVHWLLPRLLSVVDYALFIRSIHLIVAIDCYS
jgi:hypothetical protein